MLPLTAVVAALTLAVGPGQYAAPDPDAGTTGRWGWRITVRTRGGPSFVIVFVDRVAH